MFSRIHLKALVFLYAFEESVDCHLLSSFCDDSNLQISLFKYVLSTMGVSKGSISKFLIGNRFHVKLRILSPESQRKAYLPHEMQERKTPAPSLISAFNGFSGVGLCVLMSGWAYAGVLQRGCFADAPLTLRCALFLHFIPVMGCSINKSKSRFFLLLDGAGFFLSCIS